MEPNPLSDLQTELSGPFHVPPIDPLTELEKQIDHFLELLTANADEFPWKPTGGLIPMGHWACISDDINVSVSFDTLVRINGDLPDLINSKRTQNARYQLAEAVRCATKSQQSALCQAIKILEAL